MKKVFYSLLKSLVLTVTLSHFLPLHGQEETLRIPMTTEDAKNKYSTISMQRTSVHDPSIVYDEGSRLYYVFGSHMATAKTRDLQNWTGVSFPWGTVDTDDNHVQRSSGGRFPHSPNAENHHSRRNGGFR